MAFIANRIIQSVDFFVNRLYASWLTFVTRVVIFNPPFFFWQAGKYYFPNPNSTLEVIS